VTWTYSQRTGALMSPYGALAGTGYAGAGAGKNNPDLETLHNIGPVPRGVYDVTGPECTRFTIPRDSACPVCPDCGGTSAHHHGPYVLRLHPRPGTEMFGRAGFLVHGDNPLHTASEGCIIQPIATRRMLAASPQRVLEVTE
jgi:Protein of unknown function (DUF2778)